jgi:SAM-dependent methyltransferase
VTAEPDSHAPPGTPTPPPTSRLRGPQIWRLFRLWRQSRAEGSGAFQRALAADVSADLDRTRGPLAGQVVIDLGCGRGSYTRAFAAKGARTVAVEIETGHLVLEGAPPPGAVRADARRLPLADGSADGVFSSNLLEHTPTPGEVLAEVERVLRPGGWAYIAWTNWYSPWGGHDMTPYQFLGPRWGPRLYERRHGPPPKNRFGEALFATYIGRMLDEVRARPGLSIDRVEPRYWPRLALLCRIPGLREVVTWNCVIRATRR